MCHQSTFTNDFSAAAVKLIFSHRILRRTNCVSVSMVKEFMATVHSGERYDT